MKSWYFKGSKDLWEKVIEFWTGEHCHEELEILPGLFFSSTTEDGGPRFTTFDKLVSRNMNDWTVVDIPCTDADALIVLKHAKMQVNQNPKQYNMNGLMTNFLKPQPIVIEHPDSAFCSQACIEAKQSIGLHMHMGALMDCPQESYIHLVKELPIWGPARFKVNEG